MVMKRVGIARLKARLSEHLQEVRRGDSFTVMDRNTPIARVVPYGSEAEPIRVRPPRGRYPSLQRVPLPPPLRIKGDVVDVLLEDRQAGR
jgi:prevent-host-death family protein